MRLIDCAVLVGLVLAIARAEAELSGHGGPIRALAISADGATALSGSFDTSAIRWLLRRNTADQVLRLHQSAVNAVAILADGRAITAGEDAQIAVWTPGKQQPDMVLEGHKGPIVALAVSPDSTVLASAWDRTIRLWPLAVGVPQVLEGHSQNVNGVAFAPDGTKLVSAGYDATLRVWPLRGSGAPLVVTLASPLNAVAVAPDGEIVTAGADGEVYFLSQTGETRGAVDASPAPILCLAISGNGERLAATSIRGSVAIIDRRTRTLLRTVVGSSVPVWSVAFFPDNRTLLTGAARIT